MMVALVRLETVSQERVKLYRNTLETALNQLGHLPLVVSQQASVIQLLDEQDELQTARDYLSSTNTASGAAVIYVLDMEGNTVASSNWSKPESFEGLNYKFRPYFQDAIEGREGRFFAVGVTTNRPGYFISRPVFSNDNVSRILGVVVVKVELENLQAAWREGGELVMVSDNNGIIVSASEEDWLYLTLEPLSKKVRQRINENRTFMNRTLEKLDLENVLIGNRKALRIGGIEYLDTQAVLSKPEWTLHYLARTRSILTTRWIVMGFLAGGLLFSLVVGLYWREKLRKRELQREAGEAKRIRQMNAKLTEEITIRKHAETSLQATQKELVLASKMAALGRMSAAIAHEVNQPITAIKTFSASGRLLLEREKYSETEQVLDNIAQVTDRLSTITGDLKLFARTTNEESVEVDLVEVLRLVLKTFKEMFDKRNIITEITLSIDKPVILGSRHRLEQVISNILTNAIDAMNDVEDQKIIRISLDEAAAQAVLRVSDTGSGIDEAVLDKVFDPFITTKPVEQGVGLGLAISYGLIEEMGGTLRARNGAHGGAVFSIHLPLIKAPNEALRAAE